MSTARTIGATLSILVRSVIYVITGTVVLGVALFGATGAHVWGVARADDRQATDMIFVLGAAQYDGRPSNWFASRLDHAAELYHAGVAPRIVTVGGKLDGDRFTEAEAGKNYLINDHDVPEEDVIAIDAGSDTLESAKALRPVAEEQGWSTATIVTDPTHTLRSVRMVQDQGIDAVGSPTRQGPSVSTRETQLSTILHETGGLIYYQLVERYNKVRTFLPDSVRPDFQFD